MALFGRGYRLLAARRAKGQPTDDLDPFGRPHDQTIRNWIKVSTNYWNVEQKYGAKEAQRRFGGRQRQITATEPLEMVMMDHTQIDVWSTVLDEYGNPVAVGRLWLTYAIDCYSRMILGAVFTYERPSLNSVVECLRQVVRRKKFLIDEYGPHKGATDGYGKPSTVIVDNGWELVGTSFQTSCEAANIDVIWAPVKIPMFKAYVERFFGTLNENIWHRLDGGLPLTPRDRSLLDIDPTADAVHDRERIQDLFWQYVVTRYHVEVHSGIGSSPTLKWRKGLVKNGRPTVDDPVVLDTIMGITQDCLLTAEGVAFRGQRFHDPAITTQLMSDLARHIKVRKQRKGVTSTRSIDVVVTASPGNADQLYVWHPDMRKAIALPNWDVNYKKGTSWYLLDKIKKFARRENLAFHTPEEQAEARVAFLAAVEGAPLRGKYAERKRLAPFLDTTPQLAPGHEVIFKHLERSEDIAQDLAAIRTPEDRVVSHSPRRGGKKATAKAVRTRAENRRKKSEDGAVIDGVLAPEEFASPVHRVTSTIPASTRAAPPRENQISAAERLAELMKQVEQESKK
ncbi:DDE-type integrase/transposase/recombinase [Devosia marina]|uniref:DDE-type integrase/transposase/recombinase n=1 Tax=Devosia marina TaxID=2683198 RepID=A0A7X3FQP0_9HYPH|nr:DDE-type integrase/transposase/recombinase [Devosia marina]MVS98866.1 DDE-type integrase/transposase/recombinase [Devosia marina]